MQFIDSLYAIVGPAMAVGLVILIIFSILSPSKKEPTRTRDRDNNPKYDNTVSNNDQERINEWKRQEELRKQVEEIKRREEQFRQEQERRKREEVNSVKQKNDEIYYSQILGLTGKVSKAEIKKAYRELVAQYHPDKVQHLGSELQALANKKTKEIVNAYDYFKAKYNL
jgi:DnaJ-domain-containing protein 1